MTVRRATIEDAKEIFAIEMDCFSVPWSLDSIEAELINQEKKLYYVIATLTRALIEECFKRGMHEIFLEVRISNLSALSLYRQLGFTVKGMRKNYYSEPKEDAYIMSLIKEERK